MVYHWEALLLYLVIILGRSYIWLSGIHFILFCEINLEKRLIVVFRSDKCSGTFVWSNLKNLRKSSESGPKSSENRQKCRRQYVYIIKKHYTLARRYEFNVLVAKTISYVFAALSREIIVLATRT